MEYFAFMVGDFEGKPNSVGGASLRIPCHMTLTPCSVALVFFTDDPVLTAARRLAFS
jgi:hypothetical protein